MGPAERTAGTTSRALLRLRGRASQSILTAFFNALSEFEPQVKRVSAVSGVGVRALNEFAEFLAGQVIDRVTG